MRIEHIPGPADAVRLTDLRYAQKRAIEAARMTEELNQDYEIANCYRDQANMWARVALALKD